MKLFRRIVGVLVFMLVLPISGVWSESQADNGSITIVRPQPGERLSGDTVTIQWVQERIGEADHVHVIIDGQRRFPVLNVSQKILTLKKGEHQITLQAATADHRLLEAAASVRFTLE